MKKWKVHKKVSDDFIKQNPEYSPVVLQLLYNRSIIDSDAISTFFSDDYDTNSHDPFLFKNMKAACELIIQHVKAGDSIAIYGDYDADGVTASAVIYETLKIFKADVKTWIPSRIKHGYGMHKDIIKELAENNTKLIITVDNGIKSKVEVAYAKELGIDVLVTDHHTEPSGENSLPDCLIIDPIMESENYPFKYLAGVGVSFKLAIALIEMSKVNEDIKEKLRNRILDLVAVGTIADCVALTGENRSLVKRGLEIINTGKRIGLVELANIAKVNSEISEWNIGWQITPRLNVAGRLDHANTAYEILITKDRKEAKRLANSLNEKNIERQKITADIVNTCHELIKTQMDDKILICVDPSATDDSKESWAEGVVGLVAGRLTENYSKPVLVISKSHGVLKGSGRSIEKFNLVQAVEDCEKNLEKYGGHKLACGFTVKEDSLDSFIEDIKKIANSSLDDNDLVPTLRIDTEVNIEDIDEDFINSILKFSPFGQKNPIPQFVSYGITIKEVITMGAENQHIKFRLNGFWAISFCQAEKWKDLIVGDTMDIVYTLEWNYFNNNKTIQMRIVDIQKNK